MRSSETFFSSKNAFDSFQQKTIKNLIQNVFGIKNFRIKKQKNNLKKIIRKEKIKC